MLKVSCLTGSKTLSLYNAKSSLITAVVKQKIKVNRLFRCDTYNYLMLPWSQNRIRVDKQAGTCRVGIRGNRIDGQRTAGQSLGVTA